MSTDDKLTSLRREVETLRGRVAELQRKAARYEDTHGISIPEREELLAEAERLAHLGTWTWNIETGHITWSPELFRILGYDADRLSPSAEAFFGAVHPDDRERVQTASAKGVETGISPQVDYRILRPDGTIRHATMTGAMLFDDNGNLRRIVGAVLDLTEAREAAEQNQRAFELLEEAQTIGQLGSWNLDMPNRELTWTKEFIRILGLPPDTTADPTLFIERMHVDDRERLAAIHRTILSDGGAADAEGRIVRPDGEIRHVRLNGVARRDANDELVGIRGTMLDITEQVRLRENLASVQKMEAVGRLAGGIAHDFNNLLTVITTNLDLVKETIQHPLPELDECSHALESAGGLTQRLLAFGRKAQLFPKTVDANELVNSTITLLQRLVGDEVQLETQLASRLPAIRVDPMEIERALINLVVNARDVSPPGGRVRLLTHTFHSQGVQLVEISVHDEGPGIPESARAHVFEPFYTTKPEGRGTGLGLATVLGTAEQHGGTVHVENPASGGTIFRLLLPAATGVAPLGKATAQQVRDQTSASAKSHVLVIDDEERVANVIKRCLERSGHDVWLTGSPDEALTLWTQHADTIDLVICDVVMAKMRGPELIRKLSARHTLPAVLFITGYSEEVVRSDLEHPVLTKPFSVTSLNDAVARALSRADSNP